MMKDSVQQPYSTQGRPKNWLVLVMLLTLRESDSYGYELRERAAEFGCEALNYGTYYRTLRQMEENGSVDSTWDVKSNGPARRMYSITEAGESYLAFLAEGLKQYQRNMDAFFHLDRGLIGATARREGKEEP
jgi:PadR family transcriptional regulator, regulatory protein PadR